MARYTDEQFIQALTECKGMLFVAAGRLGCSYHTMQNRVEKSARLQAVIAEQIGQVLDTAELKLFQAITGGDLGAIKYLLSTKGKERGYFEGKPVDVRAEAERIAQEHGLDPDEVLREAERIVSAR